MQNQLNIPLPPPLSAWHEELHGPPIISCKPWKSLKFDPSLMVVDFGKLFGLDFDKCRLDLLQTLNFFLEPFHH